MSRRDSKNQVPIMALEYVIDGDEYTRLIIGYIAGKNVFDGSCGQHPSEAHKTLIQWASSNRTSYIVAPDDTKSLQSLSNKQKSPDPNNNEAEFEYEDDNPANLALPGEGDNEEEDDEDDDDQEDDDEFYSSNPVDSMRLNLNNEDGKFDDFDDFEALGLNGFYGKEHGKRTRGEARAIQQPYGSKQNAPSDMRPHQTLASSNNRRKMSKFARTKLANKSRRRRRKYKQLDDSLKHNSIQKNNLTPDNITEPISAQQPGNRTDFHPSLKSASGGSNRTMAASNEQLQQYGASSPYVNLCATVSSISGACVDYQSVEWAIREARRLISFRRPTGLRSLEPSASSVHAVGELSEWASRLLVMRFGLSSDEVAESMGQIDVSRTSLWRVCPRLFRSPWARQCYGRLRLQSGNQLYYQLDADHMVLTSGRYRSITGQCNNPLVPNLGSSYMPFVRMNTPEYGDGVGSSRRSRSGLTELPPARLVALTLHSDIIVGSPSSDLSALFAAWGQLINHDLAFASNAGLATGHGGSCCKKNLENRQVTSRLARVCMPIAIGPMDPIYGAFGVRCHDFKRSVAGLRPGCSLGPRTQMNMVTSFMDGSFVYGSTRSQAKSLRSRDGVHHRGQLRVWDYFGQHQGRGRRRRRRQAQNADMSDISRTFKPLLPPQRDDPDDECVGRPEGLFCFLSGDFRTNQQVPLTVLHTIHTRQHNRLARALSELNRQWSSERVYQEARHIHAAQIQHIVMREYLPLILGAKTRLKFDLSEADEGNYWDHYDPNLNPGVAQEFAAAAFRQGHSTVASEVYRVDVFSRLPRRLYRLRELFRQPWPLFEPGALDEFLLGLTETASRELDPFVSQELSGHLLQEPTEPIGLDLVAINIQRGRDQGVASYNSMRDWCGLGRLETIDDLVLAVGNQSAQLMMQLYETLDDIDLYSGGLSEFPVETDGLLGPTLSCIIGHQFSLLRRGDRYWYESSNGPHAFTPQQLASIKQTTLAQIICANSDRIWSIQPMAMRLPHSIYNPLISCQELPEIDLRLWFDFAGQQAQQPMANAGDPE